MTRSRGPGPGVVPWLTAQAVVFGAMAALLGIAANALFLDAYGSGWLPATYIAIGVAGIVVSGAVARTAQRFDLLGIALVVLGGAAAGIGIAWIIAARGDAAWVSVPLLVLFPILIQLGFVFIGGQAGQLLDIAGIKAAFPRIMTGFPVGAVVGGVLGAQLVSWLGRTEDLLLATALAQAAFAALVWATSRRFPLPAASRTTGAEPAGAGGSSDDAGPRPSLRRLLGSRFVLLILGYQVLSALGSQLADFLVYDRAAAQFPDPADLARFLAAYTAVMNVVSIAFLFLLAGPLLKRFGLRLGIAANPFVLTALAVAMLGAFALAGGASMTLLLTVSAARIVDIALTDGTTRTSINAMYQVLPERARLSVQAAVEGMGVPIAIGISGVLILALNALPFALGATLTVTTLVCVAWTWGSILLYRAYGPALVHALRRLPLLVPGDRLDGTADDEVAARRLLSSPDPRVGRLGLDLLTAMASPALGVELLELAGDPRPEVRLAALARLATDGDSGARRILGDEVRAAADSSDARVRLRAARAVAALEPSGRAAAGRFLGDPDVDVRCAALDAVLAGDAHAVGPVLDALADVRTSSAAAGAVGRLGDAMLPSLAALLDTSEPSPVVARLVRAAGHRSPQRDEILGRHVGHPDRELGLVVLERLATAEPAPGPTAAAIDAVLLDDVAHAARILAALVAIPGARAHPSEPPDDDTARLAPLRRALHDDLDLVRQRVMAGRIARHGTSALGPAMVELRTGGAAGALALEALSVLLDARESRLVLPLLAPGLAPDERLRRLDQAADGAGDRAGWLRDLVEDPARRWRSAWLCACALYACATEEVARMDLTAARALGNPAVDELLPSS